MWQQSWQAQGPEASVFTSGIHAVNRTLSLTPHILNTFYSYNKGRQRYLFLSIKDCGRDIKPASIHVWCGSCMFAICPLGIGKLPLQQRLSTGTLPVGREGETILDGAAYQKESLETKQ